MNEQAMRDLFGMWLSGAPLSPEEERSLIEGLESGAPFVKELLRDAEMDGVIRNLAPNPEGVRDLERSVLEALAAESDETRFVKDVESRILDEARRPSKRRTRRSFARRDSVAGGGAWKAALAAAAVFAVILILTISPSEPSPTQAQREDQRRRESLERVAAASRARLERERLEKELAAWEAERARLAAELRRSQDVKAQEELKARDAELARTAEAFKEKVRQAQKQERETAEAVAKSEPVPPAPEVKQEKSAAQTTVAAVAKVAQAENAFLVTAADKVPAQAGQDVGSGQNLEVQTGGSARLDYADGTRLDVGAETELKDLRAEGGKRVTVVKGTVRAIVSPQPKDQAMVFVTRDGEATVLGTTLRISLDLDPKKGTRLEVQEGKVRLNNLAGKTVTVEAGQYAVVAVGVALTSKHLPVDDVVLFPQSEKIRIVGKEWRLMRDDESPSGHILEGGPHTGPTAGANYKQRSSYVVFSFWADADKEYQVWVRGWALATLDRVQKDAVSIEPGKGVFTKPCPYVSGVGENGACFDDFANYAGYGWISGCINRPNNNEPVPAVVRFPQTGLQTLKLYSDEGKMRVSAIWLSTTQKTRPPESLRGPDLPK